MRIKDTTTRWGLDGPGDELGQGGPVKLIKCATQIYARTRDAWRAEKRVFRDAPPTVLVLRLRR